MIERLYYAFVYLFATLGIFYTVFFFLFLVMNKNICGKNAYKVFCFLVGVADWIMRKLLLGEIK